MLACVAENVSTFCSTNRVMLTMLALFIKLQK